MTPHWAMASLMQPRHPLFTPVCPPLSTMHSAIPLVSSPQVPTCSVLDLILGVFHSHIPYSQDLEIEETSLEGKTAFTLALVDPENGTARSLSVVTL